MREIKFKGKRKDNGGWVTGLYATDPFGNACIQLPNSATVDVMPETVGQYAQRLDVDLRDVYEGDIVQSENGKMWEVVFKDYSWMLTNERIKDNGANKFGGIESYTFKEYISFCKKSKADTFKKIGSIHDNPELLNQ